MKVSIIGTPHCGRTVFLGLLYETLVRMTTGESDGSLGVIVNTGPVETKAFGDLRLELLSGKWPSLESRSKVSGRSLDLGFRRRRAFPFLRSKDISTVELRDVPMSEKDVKVIRGSGQLREVLEGSPGGSLDRYGLNERFRDSLDSDIIILLADVSKESKEGDWSKEERDAFLATIVNNASRTRLGKTRDVTFMTVLTKADRAEADDHKVFEKEYPRAFKALRDAVSERHAESHVLISWLGTVPGPNNEQVPATTVRAGQVQIEYSEKEYRRLVGIIGKIA